VTRGGKFSFVWYIDKGNINNESEDNSKFNIHKEVLFFLNKIFVFLFCMLFDPISSIYYRRFPWVRKIYAPHINVNKEMQKKICLRKNLKNRKNEINAFYVEFLALCFERFLRICFMMCVASKRNFR